MKNPRWFIALIEELLVNQVDHHRDEGNGSNIAGDTKDLADEQWHQQLHDAFAVNDDRGEQQKYILLRSNQEEGSRHYSSMGHAMRESPEDGTAECQDQIDYIGMQRY